MVTEAFMKVELKKWCEELKDGLIRVCNNTDRSYLTERLPFPYTEECADAWLKYVAESEEKDGVFRAVIVDGEVAGNITVERKSDVYRKDAELGYILDKAYFGKGIATEATKLIVKEAFDSLDIARISSEVFAPNVASRRVLEKNGFRVEGVFANAAYKNGKSYDIVKFGLLKD